MHSVSHTKQATLMEYVGRNPSQECMLNGGIKPAPLFIQGIITNG